MVSKPGVTVRAKEDFDEADMAAFRAKFKAFRIEKMKLSHQGLQESVSKWCSVTLSRATVGRFERGTSDVSFVRVRKILEEWMRVMNEQLKEVEVEEGEKPDVKDELHQRIQKENETFKILNEEQAKKIDNLQREIRRLKDESVANSASKCSYSSAEESGLQIKAEILSQGTQAKNDMDFVLLNVKDLANQRRKRTCKVYVIVDEDDRIIYIGTAWDVANRLSLHRSQPCNKTMAEWIKMRETLYAFVIFEGTREECLILEAALIGCRDELRLNTFNEHEEFAATKRRSDEYENVDEEEDIQMKLKDLPMENNHLLHGQFINGLRYLLDYGLQNGEKVEVMTPHDRLAVARAHSYLQKIRSILPKPAEEEIDENANEHIDESEPSTPHPLKRQREAFVTPENETTPKPPKLKKKVHETAATPCSSRNRDIFDEYDDIQW